MPVLEDLPHVLRAPAAEPAGALVLLHGRGASERDMSMLIDVLDPQRRLLCACPRGTLEVPGTPNAYGWYIDREPGYPHFDTFEGAYTILDAWLDLLCSETQVPPGRVLIGGFSQGAVMAWALSLMPKRPRPGGILSLSGYVPRVADFDFDDAVLKDLPVAICHGANDDVVPVSLGRASKERAEAAGAQVLYRETDVGHVLDLRVVPEVAAWVGARF